MRMKAFVAALILLSLALAGSAVAQQFWEKKDYPQWSKGECKRLLEDSPWSIRHEQTSSTFSMTGRGGTGTTDGSASEVLRYTFQLRSVAPVRQAVVRCAQLENNYDKMSPEQKQAFDARVRDFLQVGASDVMLVHVVYESNKTDTERKLVNYWTIQTLETLKDKVFLITESGERIAPTKFSVLPDPGREFEFEFPRAVNGKPVITPTSKSLRFEMNIARAATQTSGPGATGRRGRQAIGDDVTGTDRVSAEFRPAKMSYKGQLVY